MTTKSMSLVGLIDIMFQLGNFMDTSLRFFWHGIFLEEAGSRAYSSNHKEIKGKWPHGGCGFSSGRACSRTHIWVHKSLQFGDEIDYPPRWYNIDLNQQRNNSKLFVGARMGGILKANNQWGYLRVFHKEDDLKKGDNEDLVLEATKW